VVGGDSNDVKVEQIRDEVIGLRPVYSDAGNCTEILLTMESRF
jgi:hypothetical protein